MGDEPLELVLGAAPEGVAVREDVGAHGSWGGFGPGLPSGVRLEGPAGGRSGASRICFEECSR